MTRTSASRPWRRWPPARPSSRWTKAGIGRRSSMEKQAGSCLPRRTPSSRPSGALPRATWGAWGRRAGGGLAQKYEDARVIVVDNASTDGSREIVRDEFPEATLVPLPENLHFARGTNAGVETALRDPECAYVMTLNNDTRMEPDALAALVVGMRDPRVGVVAAKLLFMDTGRINSAGISPTFDGSGVDRGWMQADKGQFDAALDVFGASAGAAVYRREALDRVGLFDGDFLAYYEDLDLAWRLRLAGWEARFAPGARVRHKYSASTSPRAIWKTYQGERNRIWNLVQNYPWRYAAVAVPWNASRVASALG